MGATAASAANAWSGPGTVTSSPPSSAGWPREDRNSSAIACSGSNPTKRSPASGWPHPRSARRRSSASGALTDSSAVLARQLARPLDVLDIPQWQHARLLSLGLKTIGDVLNSSEETFKKIYMVGDKRSRRIRNAAIDAVLNTSLA